MCGGYLIRALEIQRPSVKNRSSLELLGRFDNYDARALQREHLGRSCCAESRGHHSSFVPCRCLAPRSNYATIDRTNAFPFLARVGKRVHEHFASTSSSSVTVVSRHSVIEYPKGLELDSTNPSPFTVRVRAMTFEQINEPSCIRGRRTQAREAWLAESSCTERPVYLITIPHSAITIERRLTVSACEPGSLCAR